MKFRILFIFIILANSVTAQYSPKLKIQKTITAGVISIPVYDFAGIKPIFEQNNDTTYVINFWATWCIPCVQELPSFDELKKKYQHKKLSVQLISLDFIDKVDKSLIPFLKKKKPSSKILLLADDDANEWINQVDSTWSGALPATVIYNKNRRQFFEKSFTFEELEKSYLEITK